MSPYIIPAVHKEHQQSSKNENVVTQDKQEVSVSVEKGGRFKHHFFFNMKQKISLSISNIVPFSKYKKELIMQKVLACPRAIVGCPPTHCVAEDHRLLILLSPLPKCWGSQQVLSVIFNYTF